MPNRNKRQQLQSMPPASGWTLPHPWVHTPPWQQIPWRQRSADKSESRRENHEDEVKWVCVACKTTHRNPRKPTCRECGEARAPAVPKAAAKGQAGKQTGQDKPVSCGKQVAQIPHPEWGGPARCGPESCMPRAKAGTQTRCPPRDRRHDLGGHFNSDLGTRGSEHAGPRDQALPRSSTNVKRQPRSRWTLARCWNR